MNNVPDKAQVRAGNQWNSYVRGWQHGAAVKPLDPKFTGHANDEIAAAYRRGYSAGRDARNIASQDAATIYGYTPSVLRLAEINDPDKEPCASCGNPRKPHKYRHPFKPSRCEFCGFKLDQCLCTSEAAHP